MAGLSYFNLALLIVLLLPAVIMPWEGRRPPDLLYFVIAAGGLSFAALGGGIPALGWSALAGAGCLLLVAAGVAGLRAGLGLRLLTGSQIKLLAAGATWLGPFGALTMIAITAMTLLVVATAQQFRTAARRPDSGAIVAVAIFCVGLQQVLPSI
ncbi:hypothetical protein [Novosphingobium sp. TCA1]|uniref:hypothetical protein n=1 Tax=Novosphingobium sp. TCA1 TaxID=2682474 RepID=UPI00130D24C6|nr:hypothetical protein [Novosphingobium sp. TCA1]GFE77250.1 hypothetical protein NTCA1_48990 [Novosphingobium sp. TCA1]